MSDEYRIITWCSGEGCCCENARWEDSKEGPWCDPDSAVRFAVAEVGVPWVVVNELGEPIDFGDGNGMYQEYRRKKEGPLWHRS